MNDYLPMSPYDRAVAVRVARQEKLEPSLITYVEFEGLHGCETCGDGGGAAIGYVYDGKSRSLLLDYPLSPGQMIEECVQILAEVGEIP